MVLAGDDLPAGYGTVNPFVVVGADGSGGAADFIAFLVEVFDGHENLAAHTAYDDGLLIHAEVRIGDSTVMLADAQPGWRPRPAMLQVYVEALEPVVARAVESGATVVTEPTDFHGDQRLARLEDPWGTLWWLFEYGPDSTAPGEQPDEPPQWRMPRRRAEPCVPHRRRGHAPVGACTAPARARWTPLAPRVR